jgi:threonine aldolase
MGFIDLRSDTVTQADRGMRQAMSEALVGDSMFGEDPSVLDLESAVATFFGFPHAVFVPSGTMSNQLLLRTLSEPGDALACSHLNHIVQYESGALAALCGLQVVAAPMKDALLIDGDALAAMVTKDHEYYRPPLRIVAIENTHMTLGGRVYPQSEVITLAESCRSAGLKVHMDGARIWHALRPDCTDATWLGAALDSLSVCLSKGLGAPMGSCALVHTQAELKRLKRFQKMFGGCTRQAGHMAAAALYALENNRANLHETHVLAERCGPLFEGLWPGLRAEWGGTNILLLRCADALLLHHTFAERWGVRLSVLGPCLARAVFHRDVSAPQLVERLQSAVRTSSDA